MPIKIEAVPKEPPKKTERDKSDTKINKIIENKRAGRAGTGNVTLSCGSKDLTLSWLPSIERAGEYADEERQINAYIHGFDEKREPAETTWLYRAAKKFIQDTVDRGGRAYTYELKTKNIKMILWALTAGQEIFSWDTAGVEVESRDPYVYRQAPSVNIPDLERLSKAGETSLSTEVSFLKTFRPKIKASTVSHVPS